MKLQQTISMACVLAAAAVLSDSAHADGLPNPADELTLQYRPEAPSAESPADAPTSDSVTATAGITPSHEDLLTAQPLLNAKLPRPRSPGGLEAFSVQDVTAVEYRTDAGIGLGMATNTGWCISQSFFLGRGFDMSVFYVHEADSRAKSPEPRTPDIGRTIGLRLNWSF